MLLSNTRSSNTSFPLIDIKIELVKRNTSALFSPFSDGTKLNHTADCLLRVRVLDVGTKEHEISLRNGHQVGLLLLFLFSGLPVFDKAESRGMLVG